MRSRFTVPAFFAFVTLGASTFIVGDAGAHQAEYNGYSYPYGTNGTYAQTTLTCNTGAPDYDADCNNGDNISLRWYVRTRAQARVDIEYSDPFSVNLSEGAHWDCTGVLACSDGSWPTTNVVDSPCGWTTCPAGTSATWVGVYLGFDNTP